jgi:hypothetical protein
MNRPHFTHLGHVKNGVDVNVDIACMAMAAAALCARMRNPRGAAAPLAAGLARERLVRHHC